MTTQLPPPGTPQLPAGTDPPARAATPPPEEPAAARPQLRIDSAALIDAAGRTDLVTSGQPATAPRTELAAPVRLVFTVRGATPGTHLRAVARIQYPDGPGWNPRDPIVPAAGATPSSTCPRSPSATMSCP